MMMILNDILEKVDVLQIVGSADVVVNSVTADSRKASNGDLFVATLGTKVDGHSFIPSVISQGAKVIVCQNLPSELSDDVTYVRVDDSREALGRIASAWYGYPSSNLKLIGVTGTNGKTTIATLLYELFSKLGYRCGLLSTVCNYVDKEKRLSTHTTPDPLSLNALLSEMVSAGCDYAFMEVSSHSVDQRRIAGLNFVGGIFTNLTRDHLDYHKTFANYLAAKKGFFDDLPSEAFALTNLDDKNGSVILQNTKASKHTYSLQTLSDFKVKILENDFDGMLLDINNREVFVSFIGKFNAYNLLAVYGASVLLGVSPDDVLVQLSSLYTVSGRFEVLKSKNDYSAIVDYAHTPDALSNVISTINEIRCGNGKLIVVVGCGGDRDKGKRPMMAKVACDNADVIIFTSDNPRNEDPQSIIDDMVAELDSMQRKKSIIVIDREQAIRTACIMAKKGDVVLVAGKGHEDYQEIAGVKHHFDDKEILKSVM